ncbi:MAG: ECF-type sigma factor [Planctomycetota bacterium]|nr:ECF-type sigma factor [Planctomycetota bacterium]
METQNETSEETVGSEVGIPQDLLGDEPANVGLQFSLVYNELRRLATIRLRNLSPGSSMQATTLVHEAFLKLYASARNSNRQLLLDPATFFAAVSEAMRSIIIDCYRRNQSLKRGGDRLRLDLDLNEYGIMPKSESIDILALDDALEEFEKVHPEKSQLVKMKFFGGMSMEECASALSISTATASRHWRYSKAWLVARLEQSDFNDA